MTESILRSLPNNTATKTAPCEPWAFVANVPPEVLGSKEAYAEWRANPATNHLVFTATEGINPGLRTNQGNPMRRLHGLIADFDSKVNQTSIDDLLERCPSHLRPTWVARSFSGGARLVWMFEKPLPLEAGLLAKQFLLVAERELQLGKLFAGIDEPAFHDLARFYDVGHSWKKLGDYTISSNMLHLWLIEASTKTAWSKTGEGIIPIEAVAAEVERQYPGRWEGEFEVGKRGVVFFNPSSTNPTAAIVTEAGMICFSEDQLFHSWVKILGMPFVRQYQADRLGAAIQDIYYDGKNYYMKDGGNRWRTNNTETLRRSMMCAQKLESMRGKKDTSSEVDQALHMIESTRRVDGAVPFIYDTQEIIRWNGLDYLNTSRIKPIQPVIEKQEWGVNFPWIARFMEARFLPDERPYFIGWYQRAYAGALAGVPLRGHALFLVGNINLGKTLLSNKIIGASLGGFADASSHITKGSEFNKELGEVGLWCIDDGEVASDAQTHRRFSEVVKKIVANPVFTYRAMFHDPKTIPFNGRLIVTLNMDDLSIQMIPDLAQSMEEKVMVLYFNDAPFEFGSNQENEAAIARELPYYLRWLLDYQVPAEIVGSPRFGIKEYINEDLRAASLQAGGVSDLLEIEDLWETRNVPARQYGKVWEGSATSWMALASSDMQLEMHLRKYNAKQLGKKFSEAARLRDSRITVLPSVKGKSKIYQIQLRQDLADVTPDKQAVRFTPEPKTD